MGKYIKFKITNLIQFFNIKIKKKNFHSKKFKKNNFWWLCKWFIIDGKERSFLIKKFKKYLKSWFFNKKIYKIIKSIIRSINTKFQKFNLNLFNIILYIYIM